MEGGPADGPAAVLLHGWLYDIFSYVDVAPLLAAGLLVVAELFVGELKSLEQPLPNGVVVLTYQAEPVGPGG